MLLNNNSQHVQTHACMIILYCTAYYLITGTRQIQRPFKNSDWRWLFDLSQKLWRYSDFTQKNHDGDWRHINIFEITHFHKKCLMDFSKTTTRGGLVIWGSEILRKNGLAQRFCAKHLEELQKCPTTVSLNSHTTRL